MNKQTRKIKIFRALLKRDVRTISKMVTFAQLESGNKKKKTLPDNKNGTKPNWNQILQIQIDCPNPTLSICVYDQGSFGQQLVGKGTFTILDSQQQDKEESIDLLFEQKCIGKIHIKIFAKPKTFLIDYPSICSPKKSSIQQNERKIFQNAGTNLLNNNTLVSPPKPNVFDYLVSPPPPQPTGNLYVTPQPGTTYQPSYPSYNPYNYGLPQMPMPMNNHPIMYPSSGTLVHPQVPVPSINNYYMRQNKGPNVIYIQKSQTNRGISNESPSLFKDISDIANKISFF